MFVFVIATLLLTFKALCAAQESMAAAKPKVSKVGEFQEAAAMPKAIRTRDSSVRVPGSTEEPSNNNVKSTVISGMAHLDVYVKEIPILLRLMELA
jgi:hypothetical protein